MEFTTHGDADAPEAARDAYLKRFRSLERLVKVRGLGLPDRARATA